MRVYNVVIGEMNNGFSEGNCLGTFLYESAANDCMKNAVDTIQSECKNAKVSKLGETYRIDFGDGTTAVLHIEIANLVVSEKESLETDYMGVINYISNKIPDELRLEQQLSVVDFVNENFITKPLN